MSRTFVFRLIALLIPVTGFGQVISSNGTGGGAWNNASTWSGGVIPDATNSTTIRVLSGDVVNVPNGYSVTIDQALTQTNSTLRIDDGGTIILRNAAGNDLVINANSLFIIDGIFEVEQGAVASESVAGNLTASTTSVLDGGIYRHNYTTSAGPIIGADWQPGSTVEIIGYTTNASRPGNITQPFHHFVWNCPNQTKEIDLQGNLTTVNGNLSVLNTGGNVKGRLRFFYSSNNNTLNVGGSILISGLSGVWFSGTSTGNIVNVAQNVIINSPVEQALSTSGDVTINCSGNFEVQDPAGNVKFGQQGAGNATLNLDGNLNITGAITTSGSSGGAGFINFSGPAVTIQTLTGTGSVGKINFLVDTGSSLDLGSNTIRGSGSLTLNAGGELRVGSTHVNGAIQANTLNGNILVPTSNRFYNPQSIIRYNGNTLQRMATGHPAVITAIDNDVRLINNLTVSGVILYSDEFDGAARDLTVTGNWDVEDGDFIQGDGRVIFGGTTVITINGTGTIAFAGVIVNAAASLTFPSGEVSLRRGINANAGSVLDANNGTILIGGNTASVNINIGGQSLHNVTVNKTTGTVDFLSSIGLTGVLNLMSSTTINTNNNLTLLSTNDSPAADGSIAALPAANLIQGNVTVQRYMSVEGTINRYISMPVSGATVATLQDDFSITGAFTGTSHPCTGCNNNGASLRWYNETVRGGPNNGYTQFPVAVNTEPLIPGRGYLAYMWDGTAQVTWDVTGPINEGDFNLNVSHTVSNPPRANADGWNLVGNPYPSAIVWDDDDSPGWTMTNVAPTVSVVNNSGGTDVFESYNSEDGSGTLIDGIIPLGQSFWVYAQVPGASSLIVHEQAKSTIGTGVFYRQRNTSPQQLQITLTGDHTKISTFLKFNEQATEEFDYLFDAYSLPLPASNISLADKAGNQLLMHTLKEFPGEMIPLVVETGKAGSYAVSFARSTGFSMDKLYLIDMEKGSSTLISPSVTYSFTTDSDALIFSSRFYISDSPVGEVREQRLADVLSVYPNPVASTLTIRLDWEGAAEFVMYNSLGQVVKSGMVNGTEIVNMESMQSGVYIVKVLSEGNAVVKKIIRQ